MRVGSGLHRREARLTWNSDMRCGHGSLFRSPPLSKMKTEHGGKGYRDGTDFRTKTGWVDEVDLVDKVDLVDEVDSVDKFNTVSSAEQEQAKTPLITR